MIDIYVIAYHLDPNNIHDAIGTNLNVINRLFAHHIPIQSNVESFEIRKQFYNFKHCLNDFVSLALF